MKMKKTTGYTLVEVMIAMAFTASICLGLYQVGWRARRYAEYSRIATEARSLAKEKLEEINSHTFKSISQPECLLWNGDSNTSAMGSAIFRQPRVIWHDASKNVVGVESSVYAEVHVDVEFRSPLWDKMMTNTFSLLIQ